MNKRESVTDPETRSVCGRQRQTDRQRPDRQREKWRSITQPDGRSGFSELEQWA